MGDNRERLTVVDAQDNSLEDDEASNKNQIQDELSCFKDITKLVGYQLNDKRESKIID